MNRLNFGNRHFRIGHRSWLNLLSGFESQPK